RYHFRRVAVLRVDGSSQVFILAHLEDAMRKQTDVEFNFFCDVIDAVDDVFRQLLEAKHHRHIPQMLHDIMLSRHVGPYAQRPYNELSEQEQNEVKREVSIAVQLCKANDGPSAQEQRGQ